jgi:hypothetical protein
VTGPDLTRIVRAIVDHFEGALLASPAEWAAEGRRLCPDADRWPGNGMVLIGILNRHRQRLLDDAHLMVTHTPPGHGQPEWLAVVDTQVDLRRPARLEVTHPLADRLGAALCKLLDSSITGWARGCSCARPAVLSRRGLVPRQATFALSGPPRDTLTERIARKLTPNGHGAAARTAVAEEAPRQAAEAPRPR